MFFNVQVSNLIHRVTRKECSKILTRQYFGAISTHRVSKNKAHKTQSGLPGQASKAFTGIPKINLLMPVRHFSGDNKELFSSHVKKFLGVDETSPDCVIATWLSAILSIEVALGWMNATSIYTESCASTLIVFFACILSYTGGVRWGLTLSDDKPNWTNLGKSIPILLLAWSAPLMPINLAIAILALGYIGSNIQDLSMKGYPTWYPNLRSLITAFMVFGLIDIYIARKIKESLEKKKRLSQEKENTACD